MPDDLSRDQRADSVHCVTGLISRRADDPAQTKARRIFSSNRDILVRATRACEGFATFKSLALPSRGKSPVLPQHPARSVPSAE